MKKKILYLILCFFSVATPQLQAEHATLIDLGFDCPSGTGYAEFELNGESNQYQYYWSNGATTLRIEDVPRGIYTFTVIDLLGCKQEFEVNIRPEVDYVCVAEYNLKYDLNQCLAKINLTFNTDDNTVVWHDGYQGGMERVVEVGSNDEEYCATITSNLDGCCYADICVLVKGASKSCPKDGNQEEDQDGFNSVEAYPNPFIQSFDIDLKSKISGSVKISLNTSNGKTQSTMVVNVSNKSTNTFNLKTKSIPGLKFLIVEFPDGEKISTKILQIQ